MDWATNAIRPVVENANIITAKEQGRFFGVRIPIPERNIRSRKSGSAGVRP